jgi:amidase
LFRVSRTESTAPPENWSLSLPTDRADRARARIQAQWRELFRDWDVLLCPPMPTPAFPHDHSPDMRARRIDIDGQACPYQDQIAWPGIATVAGLPATTVPVERSEGDLPVGVQIVGPYLEDRTTLAFGKLLEQEFGGFVRPPLGDRRG